MNAATYTAITAAQDSSASGVSGGTAVLICVICFGLIAGIILLCLLDR